MGYFNKHSKEIAAAVLISLVYLFTRLITLTDVPIFTDEAIYLRWAQIANGDANWRFISLTDGKQPLFIWLVMASMRLFSDPLVAGRMVSVGAGFLTMLGLFFLGRELFKNRWVGLVSAGLYAIFPFALVYDRLALYDSLIGTFTIWGLFVSILVIRSKRLDIAYILGFIAGAGALNKSNAYFILYSFPFISAILSWKTKITRKGVARLVGLFLIASVIAYAMYSVLRLSPFFYLIGEKNTTFIYPYGKWLKAPLYFFGNHQNPNYLSFVDWLAVPLVQLPNNLRTLLEWMTIYTGVPLLAAMFGGVGISRNFIKEKTVLVFSFLFPFLALVSFGRLLYPRYILFMILPILPLAAYFFVELVRFMKNKTFAYIVVFGLLAYSCISCYLLITDFAHAPIPKSDVTQLYTDWPSGAGVNESIIFFREQEKKYGKIYIATAGTFGLMPYAYELYLHQDPQITIKGIWPIESYIPPELIQKSKSMPVYMVFYQTCVLCAGKGHAPDTWKVKKVFEYHKIAPDAYLRVYQILPQ